MRTRRVRASQLRDAWRRHYAEHGSAMLAFARALAPDLAEDALHDVIAHEVSKGRLPAERVEYLLRAIRNRIIAIRRRRPAVASVPPSPASGGTLAGEDARLLLSMLEETDRAIVVLRVQCGLSFPQIGVALGTPVGTVSSRYTRAIESLRVRFSEEGRSDERSNRVAVA